MVFYKSFRSLQDHNLDASSHIFVAAWIPILSVMVSPFHPWRGRWGLWPCRPRGHGGHEDTYESFHPPWSIDHADHFRKQPAQFRGYYFIMLFYRDIRGYHDDQHWWKNVGSLDISRIRDGHGTRWDEARKIYRMRSLGMDVSENRGLPSKMSVEEEGT